jgi:hypothetical protein
MATKTPIHLRRSHNRHNPKLPNKRTQILRRQQVPNHLQKKKKPQFNLSGMLEAADTTSKVMKNPKDIFFLDLDHNCEWKIVNEDKLLSF